MLWYLKHDGGIPIHLKDTWFGYAGGETFCFELRVHQSDWLQNDGFQVYIDLGSLGQVLMRVTFILDILCTSESDKLHLWISVALVPK